MTKDIVTSYIYPITFVLMGVYDPPDSSVGWKGGFELEGVYTWNDSTYRDNLMGYLSNKVIDHLVEDVCNSCAQGAF